MRIISFNLTKILAEKKEKIEEKIEINQDMNIEDIIVDNIPVTSEKVLKIKFKFLIRYSKEYAILEFVGNVYILPDKNEYEEILKLWKDRKIHDNMKILIFNFIMSKLNVRSLSLEEDIGIPYHMPMPQLGKAVDTENK